MDGSVVPQLAQVSGPAAAAQIGTVESASGAVSAVRGDARVTLAQGDPVFQNDLVETGPGASINIIFNDDTNCAVGEGGSMRLDSFVYDPAAATGELGVTMIQGVFRFVSGNVAKLGPDAMAFETPVGTIGVRGTQGVVRVDPDADPAAGQPPVAIAMLEDPSGGTVGEITFSNAAGVVTLTGPNQTAFAVDLGLPPTQAETLSPAEFGELFGTAQLTNLFARDGFVIRPVEAIQSDIQQTTVDGQPAPSAGPATGDGAAPNAPFGDGTPPQGGPAPVGPGGTPPPSGPAGPIDAAPVGAGPEADAAGPPAGDDAPIDDGQAPAPGEGPIGGFPGDVIFPDGADIVSPGPVPLPEAPAKPGDPRTQVEPFEPPARTTSPAPDLQDREVEDDLTAENDGPPPLTAAAATSAAGEALDFAPGDLAGGEALAFGALDAILGGLGPGPAFGEGPGGFDPAVDFIDFNFDDFEIPELGDILGGPGDDEYTGGPGDDSYFGFAGNDTISGGGGIDALFGGQGADILDGGSGDDTLSGGEGDDDLTGGLGADTFLFSPLLGETGLDEILDGEAADTIQALVTNPILDLKISKSGDDLVIEESPGNVLTVNTHFSGSAVGSFDSGGTTYTLQTGTTGGTADEILVGVGAGVDGGAGDDLIYGGGAGPEVLNGGAGSDKIITVAAGASPGDSQLIGGGGDDLLIDLTPGKAELYGGADNDMLMIRNLDSSDILDGGAGDDVLKLTLGTASIDFGALNVTNIETFQMDDPAGSSVVALSSDVVDSVTGAGAGAGVLKIKGDSADSVELSDSTGAWTASGNFGGFDQYTSASGSQVLIEDTITNITIV